MELKPLKILFTLREKMHVLSCYLINNEVILITLQRFYPPPPQVANNNILNQTLNDYVSWTVFHVIMVGSATCHAHEQKCVIEKENFLTALQRSIHHLFGKFDRNCEPQNSSYLKNYLQWFPSFPSPLQLLTWSTTNKNRKEVSRTGYKVVNHKRIY